MGKFLSNRELPIVRRSIRKSPVIISVIITSSVFYLRNSPINWLHCFVQLWTLKMIDEATWATCGLRYCVPTMPLHTDKSEARSLHSEIEFRLQGGVCGRNSTKWGNKFALCCDRGQVWLFSLGWLADDSHVWDDGPIICSSAVTFPLTDIDSSRSTVKLDCVENVNIQPCSNSLL